ncbi:MAG: hypothetical protein K5656_01525 [Lachnospiraceae bacterium]|nr:hypothetical protein [Lachnospiraceae bacterium]
MAKKTKDPFKAEIKRVLLYHVEIDTDGRFKAVDRARLQTWGPAEGEHKIVTLGMSHREYIYKSDLNNTKAIFKVKKAIESMGRGVNLQTKPSAACALVKSAIFYPVLIVFYENDDKKLELDFYTARTFNAALAMLKVQSKFDKVTKDDIERVPDEKSDGKYKRVVDLLVGGFKSLKTKKEVPKNEDDESQDYEEYEYDETDDGGK